MKYTVEYNMTGNETHYTPNLSKTAAIKEAKRVVKEYPEHVVFITWFRSSDSQHGYLNPNGDHAITGQSWA